MSSAMIRAVIADDEPVARRGLRQLLRDHDDIAVVGEARNGRETLLAIRTLAPDLLFLDVQMPGGDGFAIIDRTEASSRMSPTSPGSEAEGYYAAVHVRGTRHLVRESLGSLDQPLDTGCCAVRLVTFEQAQCRDGVVTLAQDPRSQLHAEPRIAVSLPARASSSSVAAIESASAGWRSRSAS